MLAHATVLIGVFLIALSPARAEMKGDAGRGEKVFRKCMACHAIDSGAGHKVGPNLHGVIGRASGTAKGYRYSKAMKDAGIVWSAETLDTYLTAPKKLVPGTRMAFPGLKSAQDRADVIAFLTQHSRR